MDSIIMSEIDWDETLAMPAANAENKKLQKLIKIQEATLISVQNDLAETEDRATSMSKHLKNVQQQLLNTQGLVSAREREIEIENQLLKITEVDKSCLQQEIKCKMKEVDELNIKKSTFENKILTQTMKFEEIKTKLNWDQQTLDEWFKQSAKKDEDSMLIEKYTRQDEAKIKELSLCIEKLIADILKKKLQLNAEETKTLTCHIELEKIGEEFRKTHLEREQLLTQWESTIEMMKKRDKEIEELSLKVDENKKVIRRRNTTLHNKSQFLQHAQDNNRKTENKISFSDSTFANVKVQLVESAKNMQDFENEIDSQKRILDRCITDLDVAHASIKQITMDQDDKTKKLQQIKDQRQKLQEKLRSVIMASLTVGELAAKMDDMLIAEEKKLEQLYTEHKLLENTRSKKQMEVEMAKAEEKCMEAIINNSYNTCKNMASKIKRLDCDMLKQEEVIYSQNLIILMLEKRCCFMLGEQSACESVDIERKIDELQKELDFKNHLHTILVVQLRKLQDCRRVIKGDMSKFKVEKADIQVKVHDYNLHTLRFENDLKAHTLKKQGLLVEQSLMKLELQKYQDLLKMKAEKKFSMEMWNLQLETALKERQQEIKIHKDMLAVKISLAEKKNQKLAAELYERMTKFDRIKMRYQFMMFSVTPPGGEEDEFQIYFVLKAVQEKDALQREGDELDANIRKAEKEILALGNTLNLINGHNNYLYQNFKPLTEASEEVNKKHALEEQKKAAIDKYRYKKKQIQELMNDLQTLNTKINKVVKDIETLENIIENKKIKILYLTKEINDQKEKQKRATKLNIREIKFLRNKSAMHELPEEKDIKVRELRDHNRNVITLILNATQAVPALFPAVQMHFVEVDLPLPGQSGSRSNPSSRRGSTTSYTGSLSLNYEGLSRSTLNSNVSVRPSSSKRNSPKFYKSY